MLGFEETLEKNQKKRDWVVNKAYKKKKRRWKRDSGTLLIDKRGGGCSTNLRGIGEGGGGVPGQKKKEKPENQKKRSSILKRGKSVHERSKSEKPFWGCGGKHRRRTRGKETGGKPEPQKMTDLEKKKKRQSKKKSTRKPNSQSGGNRPLLCPLEESEGKKRH